jgi:cell wall-associated NlpC family hydrolase
MNQWYEKYINIPYKLFGENPESGMDCYTLLRYILKQEKDITIPYTSSDFLKLVDDQMVSKSS